MSESIIMTQSHQSPQSIIQSTLTMNGAESSIGGALNANKVHATVKRSIQVVEPEKEVRIINKQLKKKQPCFVLTSFMYCITSLYVGRLSGSNIDVAFTFIIILDKHEIPIVNL